MMDILNQAGMFSIFVSILISILISITGVLPSAFITFANLSYFGLFGGLIVSGIGEAVGAIISFILYRKGLRKWRLKETQHNLIEKIKTFEGKNAFWMILLLRIMPFIPSGGVTLGAAFSKVSLSLFAAASTIGKIPSILMEAAAVYGFMQVDLKIQIIIVLLLVSFVIWKLTFRTGNS